MSNRIDRCLAQLIEQGRTALVPFITAGDPDPAWTVDLMHELVRSGANILELGFPFSDPTADGPVIQAASERSIARGVTLRAVLEMVGEFRKSDEDTAVVLMGYLNPVERYGPERLVVDAKAAGVDALLLVDCPPEENFGLREAMNTHGLYSICLLAPTTTRERREAITANARGFIYYVSFKGITGADSLNTAGLADIIAAIKQSCKLPVAVGFGIKDAVTAAAVAECADAVVIGSALVERLSTAKTRAEALQAAAGFLAPIDAAMDNG